jgi:hypothetical protein
VRFELVQNLQADIPAVEAAFLSDDFLRQLGQLPKLGSPTFLDRHEEGPRIRQRVRYAFVGRLSPAVTAVVDPARLTWVEDALVDPFAHTVSFSIVPDHYAGMLESSGTITLKPTPDGGTTRRTEGEVKVHVPFVGHKVEAAIVSGLRDHAALEAEAIDRWVAGRITP